MVLEDFTLEGGEEIDDSTFLGGGLRYDLLGNDFGGERRVAGVSTGCGSPLFFMYRDDAKFDVGYFRR
jgi:hypothetical protein